MSNNFTVDILTPGKIAGRGIPAESLLVPTTRGQINILANHTHLVTKLEAGVLAVFGGGKDADRHFAVGSGICKVLQDKVVILSEACEESHEVNEAMAKEAIEHSQQMLKKDDLTDEERDGYRRKILWAELQLQLRVEYGKK